MSLRHWFPALVAVVFLGAGACASPLDEPLEQDQQRISEAQLDGLPACDPAQLRQWAASVESRLVAYETDDEGLAAVARNGELVCVDEPGAVEPFAEITFGTPLPAKAAASGTPLPARK